MLPSPASVVHVYKTCAPVRGGIEGHVDLLTQCLAARGVATEILVARTPGTPARGRQGTVAVHRCWAPLTLASAPLPPGLPWALRRSRAELVHLHFPWPPAEVAWLCAGRGRPLVITLHCEAVRQARLARLLSPLTQTVLRRAGRILVTGRFMLDREVLAAHRDRVRVVPLGVDLDRFRPDAGARDPLPDVPRPRLVFVGRLRHYKGLSVLSEALRRLADVHLVVVGEGPERQALELDLRRAGCRQRATLLGEVDDDVLVRLLQTADAAVLPSTSPAEAFGLAIVEAQACGVPAVTTEVGTGTAQTVVDGVSGRVVPPNDPEALAGALRWCIDPSAVAVRKAAARAHAEANLGAARMVDAVCEAYAEATAGVRLLG